MTFLKNWKEIRKTPRKLKKLFQEKLKLKIIDNFKKHLNNSMKSETIFWKIGKEI